MDIELINKITDYGIIGFLGFLSFLTLMFYIERIWFYKTIKLEEYKNKEELEIELTNNIGIITTTASNAPYIGLLGTVFGIIVTFYIMGQSGNIDVKNIMTSLALALKATAMGLIVAIPAIVFNNHLVRKTEVLVAKWEVLQKAKSEA
ncbi:TonB-system energizer ExbB [Halarcobacter ebronensis]|uniref:TonB-system energizer ExbB n=1 Tax=Halarcobacter ebronensis TaxID=1462615 RepID=A0A4Q0Y7N6_9BACT|nr:TonB-system energizer ExbB [Halarcobacter ebronensis]RXJ65883.1 TonB-system energizer ExbB [Halarcobacter ebronensis]